MRAVIVGAIFTVAFLLPLSAQPIWASAASRFLLSSYHTHNDRYNVQLVSINADNTVVIVLEGPTLFRARPGQRFSVALGGQHFANFRLISADPKHQRAILEADEHHYSTTYEKA